MRKNTIILLFISTLVLSCAPTSTIISFNIRYNNPNDKENSWDNRKQEVIRFIENYNPDFLGVQEAVKSQVNMLDKSLPKYQYIGIGRDDGSSKGEHTAIFYDTTKFKLIDSQSFWLSKTPNKVSVGWDAALSRICTYGAFKRLRSKDTIHIFNTHFDHRGRVSREKAAELIINKINALNLWKKSIVFMGDLNSMPSDKTIKTLNAVLDDGIEVSKTPLQGPQGTFNRFNKNFKPYRRIDYIFTKNLKVLNYKHLTDKRDNDLWLSDHLPILIEIK